MCKAVIRGLLTAIPATLIVGCASVPLTPEKAANMDEAELCQHVGTYYALGKTKNFHVATSEIRSRHERGSNLMSIQQCTTLAMIEIQNQERKQAALAVFGMSMMMNNPYQNAPVQAPVYIPPTSTENCTTTELSDTMTHTQCR